jgi:hypothetical protein
MAYDGYIACKTTNQQFCSLQLDLPHGSTLNGVIVFVKGYASGSMPAGMPQIQIRKQLATTGAMTNIGAPGVDASPDLAAYTAAHSITASAPAEVIDRENYMYSVLVRTGGGGGTSVGFTIYPPKVLYTVDRIDGAR